MSRLSSSMRVAVIVSVGLTLPCAAQAGEPSLHGTIFDSNAQNLIKMDAATRKKVDHVMAQSDAKLQAVFNKYGINPKGEQHMVKLMEASSDLESVGHWEKAQSVVNTWLQFGRLKNFELFEGILSMGTIVFSPTELHFMS